MRGIEDQYESAQDLQKDPAPKPPTVTILIQPLSTIHRASATLVAAYALLTFGPTASAGDFTAWQGMTVLTIAKLENAAARCGYRINEDRLADLLASASLTRSEVQSRPRSAYLRQQIEADSASYRSNRDAACTRAWDGFGADASPGVRDLLQR